MLRLAGPVVLAELGWMGMGVVDTVMLGRLGRDALAGGSTGEAIFHWPALIGVGLLLGLDTVVAQAFGAGRLKECDRSLRQGVWLALLLTAPLMLLAALAPPFMRWAQVTPEVYDLALDYLYIVNLGMLPLLLYTAFRRYLQGLGIVAPITFALLTANLVNVFGNWVLIYGNLGAPAMGVAGSAWATNFARTYMALVLIAYAGWREWRTGAGPFRGSWRLEWPRVRELLSLGWPAAGQIGLEVGVFSLATVLAATLSTIAAAAHQIALNLAGLTFMVPLGVSSAAAVRVGHAVGRRDGAAARRAGWTAIMLGCGFMTLTGVTFFLAPRAIVGVYTEDATVLQVGATLLYVAAFFQLFDGLQVVSTGALRGLGDTQTPMLANLAGHWLLGLPLGWALCFWSGLGIFGLWIGLSTGLIVVGAALALVWHRKSTRLAAALAMPPPDQQVKHAG